MNLQAKVETKKILYLMHVDWYWIKQRPQFIAEELDKNGVEVHTLYMRSYGRNSLQKQKHNHNLNINPRPVIKLPFSNRFKWIDAISVEILKLHLMLVIKRVNPTHIWITHPTLIELLPKITPPVIYDCMDDNAQFFEKNSWQFNRIKYLENFVIKRAKLIICSSLHLQNKIKENNKSIKLNVILVRNAFGGLLLDSTLAENYPSSNACAYFGTISSWMDFDALLYALSKNENLIIDLYGPIEHGVNIPPHPRLSYRGVLEHSQLSIVASSYLYLIMPFKITKLIEGVDPVKLYEYINFNANIISSYYVEIARFKNFVHFYSSKEEFSTIISERVNRKYLKNERLKFLELNTWKNRANQIIDAL